MGGGILVPRQPGQRCAHQRGRRRQHALLPFGGVRLGGNLATPYRFTGQRADGDVGLTLMGRAGMTPWWALDAARPTVPEPGDPQSLNRYSYVRNNPLRLIDPSGLDDCAAGDTQWWVDQWNWKNRWYEAHGYRWDGDHWGSRDLPVIGDEGIAGDVLSEAGVYLTLWQGWSATP